MSVKLPIWLGKDSVSSCKLCHSRQNQVSHTNPHDIHKKTGLREQNVEYDGVMHNPKMYMIIRLSGT